MNETTTAHCVIVGTGHAGVQAATALRRQGYEGRVTLIGDEIHLPYHRPPLSKDYLTGSKPADKILLAAGGHYEGHDIELMLGTRVQGIDRERQVIELTGADPLRYTRLLLATGSLPRRLELPGIGLAGVHYLRNIDDVNGIRAAAAEGRSAIVIGGGYIGLETAASLRKLGMQVTVLEALDRVLKRVTSEEVSEFFSRIHAEEGVVIRENARIERLLGETAVTGVRLATGETLDASLVIVGIGILPNTELAETAGLDVDNGILVDEHARTSDAAIYAAGDCTSFVHPRYGRKLRLESVQNANDQAAVAAKAICGKPAPYDAVPWFWSDQYDVKLQIAGLAQGADHKILRRDAANPRSMSVLYLRDGCLQAVDAMNRPRDFVFGKKLIAEATPLDPAKLTDSSLNLNEAAA